MADQRKQLMAGAACLPLNYPADFFPHMSFRGRYLTGVKDELCVRAIYVTEGEERMLFLSLELGDIGSEWLPELERLTGIPADHIYLTATHTHSAPHAGGHWHEDVADVEAGEAFAALCLARVKEAVELAKKAQQPATAKYGLGSCGINVNRDYRYEGDDGTITAPYIQASNPAGISDKTVSVLGFESFEGTLIACIFSYAVHSNVTFYQSWDRKNGMLITGDLAGVAMRYIEERTGAVAAFCLAPAADQSPMFLSNHRVFDKGGNASWEYYGPEAGYALMDAQGTALGIAALDTVRNLQSVADGTIRAISGKATLECKLDGHKKKADEKEQSDSYAAQYKEKMEDDFAYIADGTLELPLYLIQLHDVNLVGIPAEIVTGIGQTLRDEVTELLGGQTMVITQCNDAYSYITDDAGYQERTFEALASHVMPGSAGRIVQAMKELAGALAEKAH